MNNSQLKMKIYEKHKKKSVEETEETQYKSV